MSTRIENERARLQKKLDEILQCCEELDEIFDTDYFVKEHAHLQRMLNQATIVISK